MNNNKLLSNWTLAASAFAFIFIIYLFATVSFRTIKGTGVKDGLMNNGRSETDYVLEYFSKSVDINSNTIAIITILITLFGVVIAYFGYSTHEATSKVTILEDKVKEYELRVNKQAEKVDLFVRYYDFIKVSQRSFKFEGSPMYPSKRDIQFLKNLNSEAYFFFKDYAEIEDDKIGKNEETCEKKYANFLIAYMKIIFAAEKDFKHVPEVFKDINKNKKYFDGKSFNLLQVISTLFELEQEHHQSGDTSIIERERLAHKITGLLKVNTDFLALYQIYADRVNIDIMGQSSQDKAEQIVVGCDRKLATWQKNIVNSLRGDVLEDFVFHEDNSSEKEVYNFFKHKSDIERIVRYSNNTFINDDLNNIFTDDGSNNMFTNDIDLLKKPYEYIVNMTKNDKWKNYINYDDSIFQYSYPDIDLITMIEGVTAYKSIDIITHQIPKIKALTTYA